jgi:hypothetical protein
MRLTIIPSDNTVCVSGVCYTPLDLSACNVPANIHALQWYETLGQIEMYNGNIYEVQEITELPVWATACADVWQVRDKQVKAPPTYEQLDNLAKGQRFNLLGTSDWTQLPNAPLADAKKQEWADYRQSLRNITEQPNYPFEINWPIAPSGD